MCFDCPWLLENPMMMNWTDHGLGLDILQSKFDIAFKLFGLTYTFKNIVENRENGKIRKSTMLCSLGVCFLFHFFFFNLNLQKNYSFPISSSEFSSDCSKFNL